MSKFVIYTTQITTYLLYILLLGAAFFMQCMAKNEQLRVRELNVVDIGKDNEDIIELDCAHLWNKNRFHLRQTRTPYSV